MKLFSTPRQKRTLQMKADYEKRFGLPYEQEVLRRVPSKISGVLIHALLVFSGVYGTILFYASSFGIAFNEPLVAVILSLVSFYAAFLYYNNVVKNVGYVVLLFAFLAAAVTLRHYANSGFAAIYNLTFDAIDAIYELPAVRHMAERMENRYESVTVCLCFLGTGGAILLNTIVSNSMNLLGALLATFPFLSIPLYFDQDPGVPSLFLIMVFYVSLIVLKYGHKGFHIPSRTKHGKMRGVVYPADGKIMGQMVLFSILVLAGLSLILSLLVPRRSFQVPEKWKSFKEYTDSYVRTFMMVGFSGYFNRYDAKGGVSGGRLGGVASIRPTFETDLIVRFAPYDVNTVYLKSFTGTRYQYNHWETNNDRVDASVPLDPREDMTPNEALCNAESFYFKELFERKDESVIRGKMEIENVNANTNYPYLPYYSFVTNKNDRQCVGGGMVKGISPIGRIDSLTYYRLFDENRNVYRNPYPDLDYLDVPYDLRTPLLGVCKEIGMEGGTDESIRKLVDYFETHYPYSTSPGTTPRDMDFVSYFLFDNKKGFCAHFASAATLLFRVMDIPARYVEGYAIPYSRIIDGDLVEGASYGEWLSGNAPLGETAVVEVEVNDSMAHAWVEVWRSDLGWVPVEVTPSSFLEEGEYSDFWSFFRDLFQDGGNGTNAGGDAANLPILNETSKRIIYRALSFSLFAILSFFFVLSISLRIKRLLSLHTRDRNTNLSNRYRQLCVLCRLYAKDFSNCHNQTRQLEWMRGVCGRYDDSDESSFDQLNDALKKACYSPYDVTREEYERSVQTMKRLRRSLYRTFGFRMRLIRFFR